MENVEFLNLEKKLKLPHKWNTKQDPFKDNDSLNRWNVNVSTSQPLKTIFTLNKGNVKIKISQPSAVFFTRELECKILNLLRAIFPYRIRM